MEQTGCIFCQIVAGRAPVSVGHEDKETLAFMDVRPVTPGHLLVIPKRHAAYLADLDEPTGGRLFQIAMGMAARLRQSDLRCDGVYLFLRDGDAAGQEVFHVHLHVIPRFPDDTFQIVADFSANPSRDELDTVAAKIRGSSTGSWAS